METVIVVVAIIAEVILFLLILCMALFVLVLPSKVVWEISEAIVYRVTKTEDTGQAPLAPFIVIMGLLATLVGVTHAHVLASHDPPYHEWSFWAFLYTLLASVLPTAYLLVKGVGAAVEFAYEALLTAIRGAKRSQHV